MTSDAPLALDTAVFTRGLQSVAGAEPRLNGIDLDILSGEVFAIVGRAGSGTTALLESLVGLRRCRADQLIVCGADLRRGEAMVKQHIGVATPRCAAVERHLRVEEALELFAYFYERPSSISSVLALLNLTAVRRQTVDSLAPSLSQRFWLALALVNDPVVLFADEPLRDLDPDSTELVWRLLRDRHARGQTTVMVTNHLPDAERADRVAIVEGGRLVAVDTPAALVARSAAPVRVVFDLPRPELDLETLRGLDGTTGVVARRQDVYTLSSVDGFATMRALIRFLDVLNVRPRSLMMQRPSLQDVFFELTGGGLQ